MIAVNVIFNHIECKVIESAKGPNRNYQERDHIRARNEGDKNRRGKNSKEQKQQALEDDQVFVFDVSQTQNLLEATKALKYTSINAWYPIWLGRRQGDSLNNRLFDNNLLGGALQTTAAYYRLRDPL